MVNDNAAVSGGFSTCPLCHAFFSYMILYYYDKAALSTVTTVTNGGKCPSRPPYQLQTPHKPQQSVHITNRTVSHPKLFRTQHSNIITRHLSFSEPHKLKHNPIQSQISIS